MTEHEPVNDEEAWEQMAEMCREELPDGTDVRNVLAAFRLLVEEMRTEQLTERDDEVDRSSAYLYRPMPEGNYDGELTIAVYENGEAGIHVDMSDIVTAPLSWADYIARIVELMAEEVARAHNLEREDMLAMIQRRLA